MNEKEFVKLLNGVAREKVPPDLDLWPKLEQELLRRDRANSARPLSRALAYATGRGSRAASIVAAFIIVLLFAVWFATLQQESSKFPDQTSEDNTAMSAAALPTAILSTPHLPPATSKPATDESAESVTEILNIHSPLLIDGENGRIYASARVNSVPSTVVLSAKDGALLASYDVAGALALDRTNNRLIVDQGADGVAILDAETGQQVAMVSLPASEHLAAPIGPVVPQVDPVSGTVFAFRDSTIYLVDPIAASITETVDSSVMRTVCSEQVGAAPVWQSFYDLLSRKLFLSFVTYSCMSHDNYTLLAYDAATMTELGRFDADSVEQAVAYQGNLYGTTLSQLGPTHYWAWNGQTIWYSQRAEERHVPHGIVADWRRQLIYEAVDRQIRIIAPDTREVLDQVDVALLDNAVLAGHDPHTELLYFVTETGRLLTWPAANLFQPDTPQTPASVDQTP